jgi:RNA recognition motif-containing protein
MSTLYIQNLNEKVKKDAFKKAIQSELGDLKAIRIVYKRHLTLKGQAFIVFQGEDDAKRAFSMLQGLRLFGKSMVVSFARAKSDETCRADGTLEQERSRRMMAKAQKKLMPPRLTRRQIMAQMALNPTASFFTPPHLVHPPMARDGQASTGQGPAGLPLMGTDLQIPNKVLLVTNIPSSIGEEQLFSHFNKYVGMVEVRMVPSRPDIAFVEYDNEAQSAKAKQE